MRSPTSLRTTNGIARMFVEVANEQVVAYLSEAAWTARFGPLEKSASFMELLLANQPLLESAVVRKVASIRRGQVVLGPRDL